MKTDQTTAKQNRVQALANMLDVTADDIVDNRTYDDDSGIFMRSDMKDRLDRFAAANPYHLYHFKIDGRDIHDGYVFDSNGQVGLCIIHSYAGKLGLWPLDADEIAQVKGAKDYPLAGTAQALISWKRIIPHLHGTSMDDPSHELIEKHITLIELKMRELAIKERVAAQAVAIESMLGRRVLSSAHAPTRHGQHRRPTIDSESAPS